MTNMHEMHGDEHEEHRHANKNSMKYITYTCFKTLKRGSLFLQF